ncbi:MULTISPECIES: MFS transporter [Streptomycetaceae]|uniref:Efflux membrane protein n=1 Tax=Streptantibioticus cattleyicolor (strain ATCC 35852 / DSM 46488 / JCM 4925 / NBRC 14057 / NRRL 8057) TaxID=1003195 RepID=G8X255_STREN|nr:MFS transporter [Streptantibioticus cattleyicolor]AEW93941.1 efflux membrane protein [Streptantibioticus cattleyicolor NRRL 8057 = DSM 46488]MYS58617.1 DHA2 family efflux MFS transporter permease subunit [Streptomyces sp. SID5468]
MPELSHRRRMLVLAICCMSLLIVSLDNTVLNVALPSMQRELHTSVSGLQWTIDAYTLVLASLLMLSGSTADRIGRRRTFQVGLAVFSAASLLCSLAPSLSWLVAARMLQAVGGSMLNPVAMSIITNTFTVPRERARAIGVWGGVVGISMAAGPIIGGALVESTGWRAIFWLNVPVGVLALVLTRLFVPESRAPKPRRVDPVGQLLMIVLLAALTYGIIETPAHGWSSPLVLGCEALAVLALLGIVWYEPRRAEPLIDLRFFRSAPFSGATVIAICGFAALGGFLFLNSLYLQDVRGLDPLHAGLFMLPMAAMTLVCAPLSGRIVGARGPRLPLLLAGAAMCASAIPLAVDFSAHTPTAWLVAVYVVFGIGFGLVNAPITNTAVSGMPRAQAGVAAAVASTSRQIGQSLGVAVIGAVMASASLGAGAPGFAATGRTAWWIVAGCGAAVLAVGTITSGRWARTTAERTAERLETAEIKVAVST